VNFQAYLETLLNDKRFEKLYQYIEERRSDINLSGIAGSSLAFVIAALHKKVERNIFVTIADKESALYLMNDIETILNDAHKDLSNKTVLYFPTSYKNVFEASTPDNVNILHRSTVLYRLHKQERNIIVITCPEGYIEKIQTADNISKASFEIHVDESLTIDFMTEVFYSYEFTPVDYVYEPGQFAVRGGIVDVFGYSYNKPYRIEFSTDKIASIRSFDPYTQLSENNPDTSGQKISILSNVSQKKKKACPESRLCRNELREWEEGSDVFQLIEPNTIFFNNINFGEIEKALTEELEKISGNAENDDAFIRDLPDRFCSAAQILSEIQKYIIIEQVASQSEYQIDFIYKPHPHFAKNIDMLAKTIQEYSEHSFKIVFCSDNKNQLLRLETIINDASERLNIKIAENIYFSEQVVNQGFIDPALKIVFLNEHQIFDRYHRFKFRERYNTAEALTIRDLNNIQPGDFVVHTDYGIGQYAGLEKLDINGREQEAICIVYKNNDLLYVSIHSLYRISKYAGKDGTPPTPDKLGSTSWQRKKYKAKSKVKDIARELIKFYALRRQSEGHSFIPDTYIQNELEASFIYEDTEDQAKATGDVKKDMEAEYPMDRLICGDVGFGKTEVAIRAACKAVTDGKQVAILVPTTILALQHFKNFEERFKDFPVTIDYLSRFKTYRKVKEILHRLEFGKIDILIGTHKILGKDVIFKDLGLLIIDEEQKFGVAAKEKIRHKKINVDTLTLTATPIPRTLQFSLLGARDLSVIKTPPPNRYPIHTEIISFNTTRFREIIMYEINRGGQVFYVHNKIFNIEEVAGMINKICPELNVKIGHGQMEGNELESIVLDFIDGKFDVFVCTTIIESGMDIPNANTMLINDAQNIGLSDLHQLRGRVGRSNKKAFCYLLTPPLDSLNENAKKRLKALSEFSDLGSGLQISMRDLDIRGAGNLLGAEQSGFISEIGYETFQKILDEALEEIKEEEQTNVSQNYYNAVKDCLLETDLSISIPDSYVSDINERLFLYKDLSNLDTERKLDIFTENLKDRFGEVPRQTIELIESVKLRLIAKEMGIVKLVLKNNTMNCYFLDTKDEDFFAQPVYAEILDYIIQNPETCSMKKACPERMRRDKKDQLLLMFKDVKSISEAKNIFEKILNAFEVKNSQKNLIKNIVFLQKSNI